MTPQEAQARLQNGLNQLRAGNLAGAEQDFRAVLKKDKRNFPALNLLAVVLMQQKRFSDAEPYLKAAYAINTSSASTVYNYGLVLSELSRLKDALTLFDKAVALAPSDAEAWNSRGLALKGLARFDDAVVSYGKAIALRPGYADAHYNLGNVLQDLGRSAEALASYDQAIALNSTHAETYSNRANVLQDLGRAAEALASVDRAIALKPGLAMAHYNRGGVLKANEDYEDALESFDRALTLQPKYVEALVNRGNVFAAQRRYAAAVEDFDRALALQPKNADAHYNKAVSLLNLVRYADAADSFARAAVLDPQRADALAFGLHAEMQNCDWRGYGKRLAALDAPLQGAALALSPFPLFPLPVAPQVLKRVTENLVRKAYPPAAHPLWGGKPYAHERPRIGYFSPDFRNHPVAYLVAELFERHDRAKFDLHGFSLSPETDDEMERRIASAFPQFHRVAGQSTADIARLVRELEIDIAVDLAGITASARTQIFALRPAPVQVNYLGFPGTMGAPYIDYIVGDPILIPPERFDGYTERAVHLPHSFQVNDTKRTIATQVPSRAELGLPEDGFVFCCFNNSYKLTPDVFDIWMRLLVKTPGSVLWMRQDSAMVQANLIAEAKKRGVAAGRLVFAARTPTMADHLARQQRADLFLDTFYYNAHTTASDALWAGLPLVTCMGDTYASRVAASLLTALDMPELITHSHADYEALILQLAADPSRLAVIRAKLARNIKTQPLFDIARFTRHIEDAYLQMWQRNRDGLPPAPIVVAP